MKDKSLRYREEICIRKQYFNGPIYCLFLIALMVITMTASVPLSEGTFDMQSWLDDVWEAIDTVVVLMVPFLLLSSLNRFFFGETICVLNEQGIHDGIETIQWDDVLSINYNMTHISRFHFRPAYVEVVCKKTRTQITSAPLYMFSKVKKFAPHVKLKHDPWLVILPVAIIVIGFVIPAV